MTLFRKLWAQLIRPHPQKKDCKTNQEWFDGEIGNGIRNCDDFTHWQRYL